MKTYIIEIWNHILVDIEIMNPYIKFSYILIDIRNKFIKLNPSYMVQYDYSYIGRYNNFTKH